ncbi:MAG: SUMF1/EgtB/PvdO family nonheme iron enzyme [Verrucomicrobiota bacterium JB022]|nr:SUMF1/EgtB/PvdO family nonheme iron enzyme [Verrucomicrobiota bacterium JB022]
MRRQKWQRWVIALAIVSAVVLGFLYGLPGVRWDEHEIEQLSIELKPEQLAQLRGELDATLSEAEAAWEREGKLSKAQLERIDDALQQQRGLILALRNAAYAETPESWSSGQLVLRPDRDRLRALEKVRDLGRGRELSERSHVAEAEGRTLFEAGEQDAAYRKIEEARRLQAELNSLYPHSPKVDEPRAEQLRMLLQRWQLAPQMERLAELSAQAEDALAEGNYDEALTLFENALSYQQRINRQLNRLPQDSVRRERELEKQIADLKVRETKLQLDQLVADAEQAVAEGNGARGLALYREAAALQKMITEGYRDSTYASFDRVHELEDAAYGAQVRPVVAQLERDLAQIRRQLANGETRAASQAVVTTFRQLQKAQELPEGSRYVAEELAEEVNLLYRLRQDLDSIQGWVEARLRPLPESPSRLLDREVHQALYEQVMQRNPSGQKGMGLPVESVSFAEAASFARRLGWIVGQQGRLPRQDEFTAAVGQTGTDEVRREAWSSASQYEDPQRALPQQPAALQPNELGFYDLLGNVSEWIVATVPEPGAQAVAGGTLRDNPIRLRSVPVEPRNVNERNPFTGFRVIIEPLGTSTENLEEDDGAGE